MKHIFFLLFISLSAILANGQTPKPGDWCAELNYLISTATSDFSKLKGEMISEDEYSELYHCSAALSGADKVVVEVFLEDEVADEEIQSVTAYYATGASEAEEKKIYDDLVTKFKACYEGIEPIDADEYGFYEEGQGLSKPTYNIQVIKASKYGEGDAGDFSFVWVVINFN